MKLDNWKEFKISEIFTLKNCKCSNAGELISGNNLLYIGAKKNENGVIKTVGLDTNLVSKGNCIVFICDGQGSVGYCNYMDRDFIGSTTLTVGYNKNLNRFNAMFIVTILDKERFKYSYGRKYRAHLEDTKIKLPEKDGLPDWNFMEKYIKSLKYEKITTDNKKTHIPINTAEWKEYKIKDLFEVSGTKTTKIDELESYGNGKYSYVTTQAVNNGVANKYNHYTEKGGVLTIDSAVLGFCTYQEKEFSASDHVEKLTPKFKMNKYIGLFFVTLFNNECYKYSYGRKANQIKIKNTILKLPTKNNKPDWQYMEDFIKSLPYADRI